MAERTSENSKEKNQEAQEASFFNQRTVGRFTVASFGPEIFNHQCQDGAQILTLIKDGVINLGTVCDSCGQKFNSLSSNIPQNNSSERTFADIKERIKADLTQTERELKPRILNFWQPKLALVEVHHCDPAIDPTSQCQEKIICRIDFSQNNKGQVITCRKCGQEVDLNIPTLKVELRLLTIFR